MGNDNSSGTTRDTLESLKAERADLEKTVVCVQQMTRDFDTLTERRKSFDAKRVSTHLQLKGPHLRRRVWAGILSPEGFQWHKEAIARKKVLGEQMLKDFAAFCQALVAWAEDLERREKDYQTRAEQQVFHDPGKEREEEANKLSQLAQSYLATAHVEDQKAALAFSSYGMGDEYERHKLAATSARNLAEEMQRRAYILTHGKEGNYRNLMLDQYGINNPDLNKIAAYYAERFNDHATLNWLSLQHPAPRPHLDANGLAMMALFPEGEGAEEALQAGNAAEKSAFEQATEIENGTESVNRPYIRKWVRDEVEVAAPKAADGRLIDPNTLLPTDNPVLGHKPGYEFWRLKAAAEAEGISQQLFNETLNNPEFYQIEDATSNASHQFEEP